MHPFSRAVINCVEPECEEDKKTLMPSETKSDNQKSNLRPKRSATPRAVNAMINPHKFWFILMSTLSSIGMGQF